MLGLNLFSEIHNNLITARSPAQGTLKAFQTTVIDAESGRFDSLCPELQKIIKLAYRDMRLANTLVSLSLGDSTISQDIHRSYVGLCSRIAENLEQLIVSIAKYDQNAS